MFDDSDFLKTILAQTKYFEYQESISHNKFSSVKGRLRAHVDFWKYTLKAPVYILEVIQNGYVIPFLDSPGSYFLKNNKSALQHSDFVSQAVADLVKSGCVLEVPFIPYLVNPLSVSVNSSGKKRLILDLSVMNNYVWKEHFKFEDWSVAYEYLLPGGYMYKFDVKSAYFHIDIAPSQQTFLGFAWPENGFTKFYVFTVLAFGITSAPFIWTKCLRPVVKYIREKGVLFVVFLDDGWGVNKTSPLAKQDALFVESVLSKAGFVLNLDKCILEPVQIIEWLGLLWNLKDNLLEIPDRRFCNVSQFIEMCSTKMPFLTARDLARMTGKIISLMPVIGNICKLMTKHLHHVIESRNAGWDSILDISQFDGAIKEVQFWKHKMSCKPTKQLFCSAVESVTVYSDASQTACAAYIEGVNNAICHRNWSQSEKDTSSTWRELTAISFALKSFLKIISGLTVRWCTDNQNCVRIVEGGSTSLDLHKIALEIYELCLDNHISLLMKWVPRDSNVLADYYSKLCDIDDWGVSKDFFEFIDSMWGPHTVDRFANHYNNKVTRFNSLVWVPGTEKVDAFSVSWAGENNWLVPPVLLISKVINFLYACKASGTLIAPYWPSSPFWPMLTGENSRVKPFISDVLVFSKQQSIFIQHLNRNTIFGSEKFNSKILAVRFEF